MKNQDFLRTIRSFTARSTVGASTVRGRGNAGVVREARQFLRNIELGRFGVPSAKRFDRVLDDNTEQLRLALPESAQHWGIARKVLNIYLRNALYTGYLRDAYRLDRAEALMELP